MIPRPETQHPPYIHGLFIEKRILAATPTAIMRNPEESYDDHRVQGLGPYLTETSHRPIILNPYSLVAKHTNKNPASPFRGAPIAKVLQVDTCRPRFLPHVSLRTSGEARRGRREWLYSDNSPFLREGGRVPCWLEESKP